MVKANQTFSLDRDVKENLKNLHNASGTINSFLRKVLNLEHNIESVTKSIEENERILKEKRSELDALMQLEQQKIEKIKTEKDNVEKQKQKELDKDNKITNEDMIKLLTVANKEEIQTNLDNKEWLYDLRMKFYNKYNYRIRNWNNIIEQVIE